MRLTSLIIALLLTFGSLYFYDFVAATLSPRILSLAGSGHSIYLAVGLPLLWLVAAVAFMVARKRRAAKDAGSQASR